MGIVVGILYTVEIIVALLLIAIILIQPSKSAGGLGAGMGGGMTEAVFGPTAGNVLTKGTVILAFIFLLVTLSLVVVTGHSKQTRSVAETLAGQPPAAAKPAIPETVPAPVTAESSVTATPVKETPAVPEPAPAPVTPPVVPTPAPVPVAP